MLEPILKVTILISQILGKGISLKQLKPILLGEEERI
jgi:hypothetical protein